MSTAVSAKLFPDLKSIDFVAVLYKASPLISSNVFFFPVTGSIPVILSSKFTTYSPVFLLRLWIFCLDTIAPSWSFPFLSIDKTTNFRLGLVGMLRVALPSLNSQGSKSAKTMTPFPSIFPFNSIESDCVGHVLSLLYIFLIILTSWWS